MKTRGPIAWLSSRFVLAARHAKQIVAQLTLWRAAAVIGITLLGSQVTVFAINSARHDQPILGLQLEGRRIGWPGGDFRKQIDVIIHDYENKTVSVKVAGVTSSITLQQLGVEVDKHQLYAQIIATGRNGNPLAQLASQDTALLGGQNISINHSGINQEVAKAYMASLDQKIAIAPTNAYFTYQDQKVAIYPDAPGRIINAEAAMTLLSNLNPLRTPEVTVPTEQPAALITTTMLEPLLPSVQAIANKPLTVAAGGNQTTLAPEQLVKLVIPKVVTDSNNPDKVTAQITFDEPNLQTVVDEVVKKAVVAPKPTIMNGSTVIQQGERGIKIADTPPISHVLQAFVQRQSGTATVDIAQIPLIEVSPPIVQQVTNTARNRTGTGLVRLTFDDGPGGHTNQVLDILKRYNVHASFYVIGRNVAGNAGQLQRIKQEGHIICNHSFNHANLSQLSWAGVEQELSATQRAIQQAVGLTPTCFRPPYGAHNQTVRQVAANLGMSVDMWSVDSRDWALPGSNVITQRVLSDVGSGAVVLLHTLNQQTVSALPGIIEGIRAQGYVLE